MRPLALAALLALGCSPPWSQAVIDDNAISACREYCIYEDLIKPSRIYRNQDGDLMCECRTRRGTTFDAHIKYLEPKVTLWVEDEK